MIEIIPNWHPMFVHFTVGLFSSAFGFYLLSYIASNLSFISSKIVSDLETAGRWCLWMAGFWVVVTVLAGLYAFNMVKHDTVSHLAMVDHRNWALVTAIAIVLMTLLSLWRHYKDKTFSLFFLMALLITQGMLLATAWRGGELVYRHGLGVMSLPQAEGANHHHHDEEEMKSSKTNQSNMPTRVNHMQHNHAD